MIWIDRWTRGVAAVPSGSQTKQFVMSILRVLVERYYCGSCNTPYWCWLFLQLLFFGVMLIKCWTNKKAVNWDMPTRDNPQDMSVALQRTLFTHRQSHVDGWNLITHPCLYVCGQINLYHLWPTYWWWWWWTLTSGIIHNAALFLRSSGPFVWYTCNIVIVFAYTLLSYIC